MALASHAAGDCLPSCRPPGPFNGLPAKQHLAGVTSDGDRPGSTSAPRYLALARDHPGRFIGIIADRRTVRSGPGNVDRQYTRSALRRLHSPTICSFPPGNGSSPGCSRIGHCGHIQHNDQRHCRCIDPRAPQPRTGRSLWLNIDYVVDWRSARCAGDCTFYPRLVKFLRASD